MGAWDMIELSRSEASRVGGAAAIAPSNGVGAKWWCLVSEERVAAAEEEYGRQEERG